MSRGRDNAAQAREHAQRRLDARELMRSAAFRRFAYWVLFRLRPVDGLSHAGELTHATSFNEGGRAVTIEVGRVLREASFDAFQRMEREARAELVHRKGDSADS